MIKMPLVSVIVTSYNYEKYISKTLESIKNQTYNNFEIIITDDCSSDNSVNICERFINNNQDLRVTLLTNDRNCGQFYSMIRALNCARGQFICFVDSDDILFEDFLETHIKVHMHSSVALTSCQIAEIGEDDELHTMHSVSSPHCDKDSILSDMDFEYEKLKGKKFGGWYWSPNSSAMFRKSSIECIKDYKNTAKWKTCPDKFLFNFANLIGGSILIYKPLVGFRRHRDNAGNSFLVTGDKKLHSDKQTFVNIKNNINIRPETIRFIWQERKVFGMRNTLFLILKTFT